ncbi:MAG: inorganic pyrophosphatase, partial [Acidimicrobiia bacterium]
TAVVNRMIHYFATYKMDMTGGKPNTIEVVGTYGAEQAQAVISAAMADYEEHFGVTERRQA